MSITLTYKGVIILKLKKKKKKCVIDNHFNNRIIKNKIYFL